MTTKEWFARGRRLDMHIKSLMATRDKLWASAEAITPNYDGIVVDGTKDPHKYDGLVQMEDMIDREVDRLYAIKQEILAVILAMPDGTESDKANREVLTKRYVECSKWENIAVEMHYDYDYVRGGLHGKALQAATPYIPNEHTETHT